MRRVALLIVASVGVLASASQARAGLLPCFVPPPIGVMRSASADDVPAAPDCYVNAVVGKDGGRFANTVRRCLPRDEPMPYASPAARLPVDAAVADAARGCAERTGSGEDRNEAYVQCVRDELAPHGYAVVAR